ncbi:MAG: hypothetical protein IJB86_00950 [Clostridia bacterium]|nr:hypothetical protein [Clostridia bacterium]
MNRTDLFIDKYKQLESAVRTAYNLDERDSVSYYLTRKSEFCKYKEDIRYCQDVRNLLSHRKKINGAYAVEPSEEMITFISDLINKVRNRPLCREIWIEYKNIFWQPFDGKVKETVITMRKRQYTQVPIIEKGIVKGVFDEISLFNYLASSESNYISDDLIFKDIGQFLQLDDSNEQQTVFFASEGFVDELEDIFEKAFRCGKRIGMAFITANGRPDEKLLGIITPWDIIAVE